MSPEAIRIFSFAFFRVTTETLEVNRVRRFAGSALGSIGPALHREFREFASRMCETDELDRYILDKQEFLATTGGVERLASLLADQADQLWRAAGDSLALVLAHSALDKGITDLVRAVALARPERFTRRIAEQSVTFREVQATGIEKLMLSRVEKLAERADRESLSERIDLLHEVCKPPRATYLRHEFRYDKETLAAIDRERQRIVHGRTRLRPIDGVDAKLGYLADTFSHCLAFTAESTGLKIDPSLYGEWVRDRHDGRDA